MIYASTVGVFAVSVGTTPVWRSREENWHGNRAKKVVGDWISNKMYFSDFKRVHQKNSI